MDGEKRIKGEVTLKPGENLVDLERNGFRIIQNRDRFCFGIDAVLLTGFARVKKGERVLDLGTGTGIIPVLLCAKTEGSAFVGLEIQEESADMALRSVKYNELSGKIDIVQGDIKTASVIFGRSVFNVVTANPPYMEDKTGLKNPESEKAIARHEILCSLEDVIREAAAVLVPGGRFYMVHRPRRLTEIIEMMREYRLEPRRIRMVHPYVDRDCNMVLIEGIRNGGQMLTVEKPLIVYERPGVYTEEIENIYRF